MNGDSAGKRMGSQSAGAAERLLRFLDVAAEEAEALLV